jgi:hypothetical protein
MRAGNPMAFSGFNVGAMGSAVLLAFGIESLLGAIESPLTAIVMRALNWIIRRGQLDVMPLQPPEFSWILLLYAGLSGVILLVCGTGLAAWATDRA